MTNQRQARRVQTHVVVLALALLVPGDYSHAQQPTRSGLVKDQLRITGSLTVYPLVSDIAHRFEEQHPGVKIDVEAGGSAKAQIDVRVGTADIGMLPRALRSSDHDLFAYPIARDGIAAVVNNENPVRGITTDQLAGIISGRISNWKALGGRDAPIRLALREQPEGSTDMVLEHLKLRRTQLARHTSINTTADAITFAANAPDGIALASIGQAERSARAGVRIKLLAYNGFPAESRTIQNHLYALSRPLTLITRRPPQGLQKQFIDYAVSTSVVDLQLKYGFVPYEQ